MRLDVILPVFAPAGVAATAGIGRGVRHLCPGITLRSQAVLELIVHEIAQELQRAEIARIGVQALDEPLHHRAQVSGGIGPLLIRPQFKGDSVEIETAVEIGQSLSIILIPDDGPLR